MTTGSTSRRLHAGDLPAYRAVRLASLAAHPEAYSSSWDEEQACDDAAFLKRMLPAPPGVRIGAFDGMALVAIGGLIVFPELKTRHAGLITGVYVDPSHRRGGEGRGVMAALLDAAREAGVVTVGLTVTVGNDAARAFYLGLGFRSYGVSRRALRVDDRFFDVELMAFELA